MPILNYEIDESVRRRFDAKHQPVAGPLATPCWHWTDKPGGNGYGYLGIGGRKGTKVQAHRLAWEIHRGAIPEGFHIDHLCRVRHCVNPDHLEPVTQRVNLLRGETIARRNALATHCLHGHAFDETNTYLKVGGGRQCRACSRDHDSRRRGRKVR